jgi:hypothetical protein
MVQKIALTSTGPMSGKSTLAKFLAREYGFYVADHSLSLVKSFVGWYNQQLMKSGGKEFITVETVYQDKERWRKSLQEHGYRIGFNAPGQAGTWIQYTLDGWYYRQGDVVFDSFRGEEQAHVLKDMGFILVQIEIPESVRELRYTELGRHEEYERSLSARKAHPEIEDGIAQPDVRMDGTELPGVMACRLIPEGHCARR